MHDYLRMQRVTSVLPTPTGTAGGPVDMNATGDKFILTPTAPIDVYRFGYITDTAQDPDVGGFVLAMDLRPTAGSDTSRSEIATITRADAAVLTAGKVIYQRIVRSVAQANGDDALYAGAGPQTSVIDVAPTGPLKVNVGQEVVLEVTNANGAASTGYLFIEYVEQPLVGSRATAAAEVLS